MEEVNLKPVSQIAEAILTEGSGTYEWSLRWGPHPFDDVSYGSSWPKNEAAQKAIVRAFGEGHPFTYQELRQSGMHWNPAAEFVRKFVRTGEHLPRIGFLDKLHAARVADGMGSGRAELTLTIGWASILRKTAEGYFGGYVPAVLGPTIGVRVEWFGDGSILLSSEELSQKRDEIFELYVWKGCVHEFEHRSGGRCYHIHTCKKCGHRYDIDSSD